MGCHGPYSCHGMPVDKPRRFRDAEIEITLFRAVMFALILCVGVAFFTNAISDVKHYERPDYTRQNGLTEYEWKIWAWMLNQTKENKTSIKELRDQIFIGAYGFNGDIW